MYRTHEAIEVRTPTNTKASGTIQPTSGFLTVLPAGGGDCGIPGDGDTPVASGGEIGGGIGKELDGGAVGGDVLTIIVDKTGGVIDVTGTST